MSSTFFKNWKIKLLELLLKKIRLYDIIILKFFGNSILKETVA